MTAAATVQITGNGGSNGGGTVNIGLDVGGGAQVTATGGVTLTGTGGPGTDADFGVVLDGTTSALVQSAGFVKITGRSTSAAAPPACSR